MDGKFIGWSRFVKGRFEEDRFRVYEVIRRVSSFA